MVGLRLPCHKLLTFSPSPISRFSQRFIIHLFHIRRHYIKLQCRALFALRVLANALMFSFAQRKYLRQPISKLKPLTSLSFVRIRLEWGRRRKKFQIYKKLNARLLKHRDLFLAHVATSAYTTKYFALALDLRTISSIKSRLITSKSFQSNSIRNL